MRIEEEIKQPVFKDIYQKAYINLVYTAGWVEQRQAELLRIYGLTLPQYNILRILRGQHPKPATVNLLIERMLDKTSNASRIVDKLVAKELVSRTQCEHDRRTVDVLITQGGLDLLKRIDDESKNLHAGVQSLTEDEAEILNQLLDKIRL
ncbi:MarR family winged helix-turn-helix transcriptional regulator [Adhaeribacter rhizoryzae]|uniref:MarR family transcriptional regulator n=1 Tax=Adhaeribacter rhizoryzae TaxID=2607907 RepID=A0A5M6DP54_9BACT|nr:MarR family transcriptional regulator [Adhaeribacter rhizoryzae]KAA5548216.1 MarR family transcriptional regulator [Adhaeribacter rhizoryzae]